MNQLNVNVTRRVRKTDFSPIPQMQLVLHPENAEGIGADQVNIIHRLMLEDALSVLRNGESSEAARVAAWEWLLDPLFRTKAPAGTMKACCQTSGFEAYGLISSLVWQRRNEVDRIFGSGAARKLRIRADALIPASENLAVEFGGRA